MNENDQMNERCMKPPDMLI